MSDMISHCIPSVQHLSSLPYKWWVLPCPSALATPWDSGLNNVAWFLRGERGLTWCAGAYRSEAPGWCMWCSHPRRQTRSPSFVLRWWNTSSVSHRKLSRIAWKNAHISCPSWCVVKSLTVQCFCHGSITVLVSVKVMKLPSSNVFD